MLTSYNYRTRNWMGAVALATVLGGSLVYMRSAVAQPAPLEFIPLAIGPSSSRIRLNEKGPSDVWQTQIVIRPGGDTGWHTHPGPVIVVLKSGAVTEYHSNGCVSVHVAPTVFFESPGDAHRVINQTSTVSESYATFILPPGSQPIQPIAPPATGVCRP